MKLIDIVSAVIIVAIVLTMVLSITTAPVHDSEAEVTVSQSLSHKGFVEWLATNKLKVADVNVYTDGKVHLDLKPVDE